jgi:hypothetical protein
VKFSILSLRKRPKVRGGVTHIPPQWECPMVCPAPITSPAVMAIKDELRAQCRKFGAEFSLHKKLQPKGDHAS